MRSSLPSVLALACGPISRLLVKLEDTGEIVEADVPRSDAAPCPPVGAKVKLRWRKAHRFPGKSETVTIAQLDAAAARRGA